MDLQISNHWRPKETKKALSATIESSCEKVSQAPPVEIKPKVNLPLRDYWQPQQVKKNVITTNESKSESHDSDLGNESSNNIFKKPKIF